MQDQKRIVRQEIKNKCAKLDPVDRKRFEDEAFRCILPLLDNAKSIVVYHAYGFEFDLAKIIQYSLSESKKLYQPVSYRNSRHMKLIKYDAQNKNVFSDPDYVPNECIEWYNTDLVILPLVAVDGFGYRLGKGGGYYDTTLANLPKKRPILCGIGYSCQVINGELPHEEFDVKLDYFVSDAGLTDFYRN